MQLIVPFASVLGDEAAAVRADLDLPALGALLQRLPIVSSDEGDEASYTPPHERALARALGLAGGDGTLPWAAHQAAAAGLDTGDLAWGELTPVHCAIGRDAITLVDPAGLDLDDDLAAELFAAIRPLFVDEGFALEATAARRWLAAHETLADLRCASIDRVVGRRLETWVPEGPGARLARRLQNEVQMLLYQHPAHDRRTAAGQLPVNSVWWSGCGRRSAPAPAGPDLQVDDRLRGPALQADWAGWREAWRALDSGPLRQALDRARDALPVQLVLCGERGSLTLSNTGAAAGSWLDRLRRRVAPPAASALLERL
jgi:hypothetical protein